MFNKSTGSINIQAFGTVDEALERYGRTMDPVPGSGDCMFESIARQLPDINITASTLRQMAVDYGFLNEDHLKFFCNASIQDNYQQFLSEFRQDGHWNDDLGDIMLTMISGALGPQEIIVIRNGTIPVYFNLTENDPVTSSTVVIIQNDAQTHFDATRSVAKSRSGRTRSSANRSINSRSPPEKTMPTSKRARSPCY